MISKDDYQKEKKLKIEEIDVLLKEYLPKTQEEYSILYNAMHYSLFAGGKRLRPMVMLESFQLFSDTRVKKEEVSVVYPFMAAIEMIHTYSLIHDDLPALDNDDFRRGKPTSHIAFGEDIAILAGDGLLNSAFEVASRAFDLTDSPKQVGVAMQILATKAGVNGMIGGQVIDVITEGMKNEKEVLDKIYILKTAALLEASFMIGAVLAGATKEDIAVVEQAAQKIGIAFQIQDDVLDITSTQELLGKPIFSDRRNQKSTYVSLFGLETANQIVKSLFDEAIDKIKSLPYKNEFLEQVLLELIYREK